MGRVNRVDRVKAAVATECSSSKTARNRGIKMHASQQLTVTLYSNHQFGSYLCFLVLNCEGVWSLWQVVWLMAPLDLEWDGQR